MPVHRHLNPHPRQASPLRLSLTMIGVLSSRVTLQQAATEQVNIGIPCMETLICYGILSWVNVNRSMHTSSKDYISPAFLQKPLLTHLTQLFVPDMNKNYAASTDLVYQLETCILVVERETSPIFLYMAT